MGRRAAQGGSDALAQDRRFADPGVGDAKRSVCLGQARRRAEDKVL
jgi:hypothetical protein